MGQGAQDDGDGEYVLQPTIFRLVWPEGDPFHGVVVRVLSLPMGLLLEAAPRIQMLTTLRAEDLTLEQVPEILQPFRMLGEYIVSWNLKTDLGNGVKRPVPASFEGLLTLRPELIGAILTAWTQASGTISAPLGEPSSSGDADPLLADLPMTGLSDTPSGAPG